MKKNKLKLDELNVKSFTTSADKLKGGGFTIVTTDPYTYFPTKKCPIDVGQTGEGLGLCEAATNLDCGYTQADC